MPRTAAQLLRASSLDAVHTAEIGMATAEDPDIAFRAEAEMRVVVTMDSDFHSMLATSGARTPSVIRIRIEGLHGGAAAIVIHEVLKRCDEDLVQGALITVQPGRIRVHRLPIVKDR